MDAKENTMLLQTFKSFNNMDFYEKSKEDA